MRRRLLQISTVLLAIILCMSVSSCRYNNSANTATAKESQKENTPQIVEEDPSDGRYVDNDSKINEEEEDRDELPEDDTINEPEVRMETYPFKDFESTFRDGRAWVKYFPEPENNPNYYRYAMIDETGYIWLTSDEPGTPVSGGLTVLQDDNGFKIYDVKGRCTFASENTPERQLTVVGSGDGIFVVIEHEAGFAGNTYTLYEIGYDGTEASPRYEATYNPNGFSWDVPDKWVFTYYDADVFVGKNRILTSGKLVDYSNSNLQYSFGLQTPFVLGRSFGTIIETGPSTYFKAISLEDIESLEALEAWDEAGLNDENICFSSFYGVRYSDEGVAAYGNGKWISFTNYDSSFRGTSEEYPDSVKLESYGNLTGGYMPLLLRGADGYYYFTLLDSSGVEMYDPICPGKNTPSKYLDTYKLETGFARSGYGYIVFRTYNFTGVNGFACINPEGEITWYDQIFEWNDLYAVDDNYVYFTRCLSDHEGNILFDKVSCSVNDYGDVAETVTETPQKNYVNPSSFIIEGKWKSVGTYGFGQAQPGAIVTFDGVHCNLYSPSDTYAFYKSGDTFVLDCTGVLSGTEKFTVKIVDDNNIDLYSGGLVTELTRVG